MFYILAKMDKEMLSNYSNIELNTRDKNGWTAFQMTCFNRHKDVVKFSLFLF